MIHYILEYNGNNFYCRSFNGSNKIYNHQIQYGLVFRTGLLRASGSGKLESTYLLKSIRRRGREQSLMAGQVKIVPSYNIMVDLSTYPALILSHLFARRFPAWRNIPVKWTRSGTRNLGSTLATVRKLLHE